MTTQEGNKLIAEFLGLDLSNMTICETKSHEGSQNVYEEYEKERPLEVSDLRYHLSWNALMPVVLKILDENSSSCYLAPSHFFSGTSKGKWDFTMLDDQINSQNCVNDNPITAVWQAVVQYLTNKQQ